MMFVSINEKINFDQKCYGAAKAVIHGIPLDDETWQKFQADAKKQARPHADLARRIITAFYMTDPP